MDLKLFRSYQKTVSPDDENYLEDSMTFINDSLVKLGMSGRQIVKAELMAEETIEGFRDHSAEGARLIIVVRRSLGSAYVVLRMKGEAYEPCLYDENSLDSVKDDQSVEAIRSILLDVYRDSYKYTNKSGTNKAIITVERSGQAIRATILALILGLLVGIIGNTLLPAPLTNAFCNVILDPINTMFMNALQIIIAPVVFLSLLTCISQYSNIAELGKLGAKVMGLYLLTTTIAIILLSLGAPGVPGAGLVCLGVVLEALHVPVEAVGLIIAVNPIMDMFSTMSNTTGDMTVSLITARSEGLFDKEVYLNENAGAVEKK